MEPHPQENGARKSVGPLRRRARLRGERAKVSPGSFVLALLCGLLVIGGAAAAFALSNQGIDDEGMLHGQTQELLEAWAAAAPTPAWDRSNDHLFAPSDWEIKRVKVADGKTEAETVAWVRSTTKAGEPVEALWTFQWQWSHDHWQLLGFNPAQ